MNYLNAFENGKEKLMRAGVDEYALDARLLLECVCGTDHSILLAHPDRELSQEEEAFFSDNYVESERLIVRLASNMSPEGVVRMARLADRYFADHSLHYGRETGFVLYFWVRRRFFPEKPTMLDYWLIREYNPLVSEKYTTASGFLGELRADFGWFSLLFVFLFGMLMRRLDDFSSAVFSAGNSSFDMVLASLLYPWVFFFVRSPVTSTISLLWELVLFYGLYILFSNKIKFR